MSEVKIERVKRVQGSPSGQGLRDTTDDPLRLICFPEVTNDRRPQEWADASVDSVCKVVSVGIVVNPSHFYVSKENGVRAFRSGNVRENTVADAKWVYLSHEGNLKNKKSILQGGDVLVVRTGFAGTACVVPDEYAGCNCIDVLFARPDIKKVLPEYLAQLTNSELGRRQVLTGQSGLAQKHLNVATFSKMRFCLPPIAEQRRIAHILSTWDSAIATAKKQVSAAQRQLDALAMVVLMGRRRLKPVTDSAMLTTPHGTLPGDWRYARIGELATEVNRKPLAQEDLPVLSCTKHEGLVDSLTYFKKRVFSEDTSNYKLAPRGSFVYATNHLEEGSIGYQDLYEFGLVSPMYTVFRTAESVCDGYLYALLKTEHYRQIFASATNASVDRRGSLRWKDFSKLKVPVPPIDEQVAISDLLRDAGRERDLLEEHLENLQVEKAALLSDLLTGRRRVQLTHATTAL